MGKIHNSVYDNDFIIKICGWKSVIKNKENRILLSKVWSFQYLFILKNRRDFHISVNIAPRTGKLFLASSTTNNQKQYNLDCGTAPST